MRTEGKIGKNFLQAKISSYTVLYQAWVADDDITITCMEQILPLLTMLIFKYIVEVILIYLSLPKNKENIYSVCYH